MKKTAKKKVAVKKITVSDTRFGKRTMSLSKSGQAKKGVYMNPGRGANGESSS